VLLTDTQEEAPERFGAWTRQRSRWFKGWMQTWLVHMRQPRALYKAMGRPGFFTFQILIGGMLISALIHPLYLITFSLSLAALLQGHVTAGFWLMLMINCLNLIVGYGGAMALGHRASHARCGTGWRAIAMMPLYWLVMTPAAWRALYQLLFDPHHWEKTEHGLSDDRPQVCGKI
jgi:glycosyltransferase XagB